jgi:hypothetical protein
MSNVIWTNHLQQRIRERGLDPSWVDKAVRFPDRVENSSTTDSKKHIKVINGYKIVAAVKRQGSDWIVTSAWWNKANSWDYKVTNKLFFEVWAEKLVDWLGSKLFGRK